eukprot:gene11044-biopygen7189
MHTACELLQCCSSGVLPRIVRLPFSPTLSYIVVTVPFRIPAAPRPASQREGRGGQGHGDAVIRGGGLQYA